MSRKTIWFIAAALFLVAAVASGIGSQWVFFGVALAIAAAFFIFALVSKAAPRQ